MKEIFDFIRAAAPWVVMGLLVAVLAVKSTVRKKKDKKSEENYDKTS